MGNQKLAKRKKAKEQIE